MYIVPIFLRKYDLFRRKTVLFTEFFRRIIPAKHNKAGVSALFVPCWLLPPFFSKYLSFVSRFVFSRKKTGKTICLEWL